MITALSFVPPDQLIAYFEILSEEFEVHFPSLQPILDWMEINYIGIMRRGEKAGEDYLLFQILHGTFITGF